MQVNIKQATDFIVTSMRAKLVTMLSGTPGIGKSAIIYQIAEQYSLEVIDVRLSQCDPTDLLGFPSIDNDKNTAKYVPMDIFPTKNTPIPEGKTGFVLFLDEFNSASLAVQAAAYRLVLDRQIGQHPLHPNTTIVCAGNGADDGAIVNRLSTAMQSRLVHLELIVNPELWIEWATKNNINHKIIAYINHRPENLHKFDPKHNDKTFACCRTWEFVSKIMEHIDTSLTEYTPLIAGTISESIAREFIAHTEIYTELPTYKEIVNNPLVAKTSDEPGILYAVSHMIASYAKEQDIDSIMLYIDRIPFEFQTIILQNILRKDISLQEHPAIEKWVDIKGEELL